MCVGVVYTREASMSAINLVHRVCQGTAILRALVIPADVPRHIVRQVLSVKRVYTVCDDASGTSNTRDTLYISLPFSLVNGQ